MQPTWMVGAVTMVLATLGACSSETKGGASQPGATVAGGATVPDQTSATIDGDSRTASLNLMKAWLGL